MSTLSVDTIQGQTTAANVKLPAGAIVQTVQYHRRGQQDGTGSSNLVTISTDSLTDVMSKAITTKFANSLIHLTMNLVLYDTSGNPLRLRTKILRNSTEIDGDRYAGYGDGGTMFTKTYTFLDTPSAAAGTTLTYKLQVSELGNSTVGVGYGDSGGGSAASIILMEIAQ